MSAGRYESTYVVASHPTEPIAVWIRYTVHQPPNRLAVGSIWCTLFTPEGPTAVKVSEPDPHSDEVVLLAVGTHGAVRRDGADGAISGHGVDASWQLRFDETEDEFRHLPYEWLYRAPVPRTKSTSPYPAMRVSGRLQVGAHAFDLDGWRGMLGHNWGSEHAHRWIWLRGAQFDDHPEAWLDVVIGRIKIGPLVAPWTASGALCLDGIRERVGGLGRRVGVHERPDGCDLTLPFRGGLTVRVSAPLARSVGWEYADPAGAAHQVRNCSIAQLVVDVHRAGRHEELTTSHGGVYELGTAEFDPAVTMQPYRDGRETAG